MGQDIVKGPFMAAAMAAQTMTVMLARALTADGVGVVAGHLVLATAGYGGGSFAAAQMTTIAMTNKTAPTMAAMPALTTMATSAVTTMPALLYYETGHGEQASSWFWADDAACVHSWGPQLSSKAQTWFWGRSTSRTSSTRRTTVRLRFRSWL